MDGWKQHSIPSAYPEAMTAPLLSPQQPRGAFPRSQQCCSAHPNPTSHQNTLPGPQGIWDHLLPPATLSPRHPGSIPPCPGRESHCSQPLLPLCQGTKRTGIPGMEPFDSAEAGSREPIPGGASHTQILEKSREIWVSPLPGSSCIPQGSARHLPVPKAVSSVGRGISSTARTHGSWKFQGSRSSGMATAASRQCRRDRAAAPAGSSGMMDGVKWSAGKGKRSTPG